MCGYCNVVVHRACATAMELESAEDGVHGSRCRWCEDTHQDSRGHWLDERDRVWREHVRTKAIDLITEHTRVWRAKRDYRLMLRRVVMMQSHTRGWHARKRFLQWRLKCKRPFLIRLRTRQAAGNEHAWATTGMPPATSRRPRAPTRATTRAPRAPARVGGVLLPGEVRAVIAVLGLARRAALPLQPARARDLRARPLERCEAQRRFAAQRAQRRRPRGSRSRALGDGAEPSSRGIREPRLPAAAAAAPASPARGPGPAEPASADRPERRRRRRRRWRPRRRGDRGGRSARRGRADAVRAATT